MPHGIQMKEIPAKKSKKRLAIVISPGDRDKVAMARFVREHPEYIQVDQEFFWKHDGE